MDVAVEPGESQQQIDELKDLIGSLRKELQHKNKMIDLLRLQKKSSQDWKAAPILEEDNRQSRKMEALGHMALAMAHDFNNLLVAINGYSALLLEKRFEDEEIRSGLEQICRAGERATGLTRQILAFSRKKKIAFGALDVNSVMENLSGMLERLLGKQIDLQVLLDPHLELVLGDSGQMEQALLNLALNARDAMPGGGRITFATANSTFPIHSHFTREGKKQGPCILVSVTDTGVGMDKSTLARIFDPFYTTKSKGSGTGVGLTTVFGIVRDMGGDIEVASHPGRGTVFSLYIPCPEPNALRTDATDASQTYFATDFPPATLLVVEDDDSVRALVCAVLRMAGHQVLEAANGEDALEICSMHEGNLTGMITDKTLPRHRGVDLAEQVRELRPDMRVLFMSGTADESPNGNPPAEDNRALGLFLEKPFTPKGLLTKLRELLIY